MANADSQPSNENPIQPLGEKKDHYPIRCQSMNRWLALILGILFILSAAVFGLIDIFNTVNAIQSHGRAVILSRTTNPLFVLCLILPTGILLLIIAAVNWQNGFTLYEEGFILRRRGKEKTWFWRSIRQFDSQVTFFKFSGNTIGKQRTIIIRDDRQKPLRMRNRYKRMDELVDHLRGSILPELFTRSRKQLLKGESLFFHQCLIAFSEGLQIKNTVIPWDDLQISISKKGILAITNKRDQTQLFKSKTRRIRNLDVLIYLLENPPV
jgi:hypothetical protein